jgi:hypothetical protein
MNHVVPAPWGFNFALLRDPIGNLDRPISSLTYSYGAGGVLCSVSWLAELRAYPSLLGSTKGNALIPSKRHRQAGLLLFVHNALSIFIPADRSRIRSLPGYRYCHSAHLKV